MTTPVTQRGIPTQVVRNDGSVVGALLLDELAEALADCSPEGVADGIVDLIYLAAGAGSTFGIPLGQVWNDVHRANMGKFVKAPDGTLVLLRDANGKGMKPPGWQPPDTTASRLTDGYVYPSFGG
jgi:predicted HAD superfamily Cof-like phosphohydrolase